MLLTGFALVDSVNNLMTGFGLIFTHTTHLTSLIVYWFQSISGTLDFVFDHIKEYQLDIVALTETWLSSEDSKNKHIIDQCVNTGYWIHGYTFHHSPRTSGRRGGGVDLLVSNAIKVTFKRIHVSPLITSF